MFYIVSIVKILYFCKLIPKYFILFHAIANRISMLKLDPTILLDSLVNCNSFCGFLRIFFKDHVICS